MPGRFARFLFRCERGAFPVSKILCKFMYFVKSFGKIAWPSVFAGGCSPAFILGCILVLKNRASRYPVYIPDSFLEVLINFWG